MALRKPAEVFPPGDVIKEEMEFRGWSQSDLAEILDRPLAMVNDVVSARRSISLETARGLGAAFGTSAEFWLNMDATFQLSKLESDNSDAIARRAILFAKVPLKEMSRRGWIEPTENVELLESRVLRFLRIESLDQEPELPLHAARKSTSYHLPLTPLQKVWLIRSRQLAKTVSAATFQQSRFDELMDRLRLLLHIPQEVRHVPRLLAEFGIKLVVVEGFPGSKIDGASYVDEDGCPVIAMTLRFDRIDHFWFVLMHELGHVKNGTESIDVEIKVGEVNGKPIEEMNADRFALDHLVPPAQLDNFIARIRPMYSSRRIEAFAKTMGVHPGIVVGQLQHRGEIAYSMLQKLLVPIRSVITESAVTDGWGSILPSDL